VTPLRARGRLSRRDQSPSGPSGDECRDLRGTRAWRARVEAPEGTVNLVFGFNAGTTLVDAPSVSAVGFTGSVGAGLALWERANTRSVPIPFFGELGSANPLVVTASAADERPPKSGLA